MRYLQRQARLNVIMIGERDDRLQPQFLDLASLQQ
jgi:hypothetical protein